MSVIKCKNCCKDIDTDKTDMICFLDKYWFCEDCVDRDEMFEILDEMQAEIDRVTRLYEGSVKALVNANAEVVALYDAARQAMDAIGRHVE